MRMSMILSKPTPPSLNIPSGGLNMQVFHTQPRKEKVVVIMGATGTGKSRLSIDLANHFAAEIVNSDKIQVYKGLNIVTNKITAEEQSGVPHHLLGMVDPNTDFTQTSFCRMASLTLRSIVGRGQLPIIVGGSNSYIEALVDDENHEFRSKYECCFLWVDVSMPVLHSYVSERVDRMVENGMVDEVRQVFDPDADYSRGIRRAIGVPEFDRYFRAEAFVDEESTRARLLQEAVNEVKNNTCKLACRQLEKIYRLRNVKGWRLRRLDATDVFRKHGKEADDAWEDLVAGPCSRIVSHFLSDFGPEVHRNSTAVEQQQLQHYRELWQLQHTWQPPYISGGKVNHLSFVKRKVFDNFFTEYIHSTLQYHSGRYKRDSNYSSMYKISSLRSSNLLTETMTIHRWIKQSIILGSMIGVDWRFQFIVFWENITNTP